MARFLQFTRKHWVGLSLAATFLIAVFFRFYQFPHVPPSLNWDEVAIAYNAHSLLKTGMDEYGDRFPLLFRSFDDYKMPVYVYITMLFQVLVGYNDAAVRLPAALCGVLSVLVLYALVNELTKNKAISLISSLILAVLPWHVQFTRYALESSVGFFFILSGVLTMLWGFKKSDRWLIVSSVCFSLSMHTYLSYRILAPIIVLVFAVYFWKRVSLKSIAAVIAIVIFLTSSLIVANQIFGQENNTRFSGVSILNNPEQFDLEYKRIQYEGSLGSNIPRRIFHQPQLYLNTSLVTHGYLKHYSPDYIFFDRGLYHHAPNVGLIYAWMILFIPIGTYFLFKKYSKDAQVILMTLFLVAPIASAFTIDTPHPIRTMLLIAPLTVFTAIGAWSLYELLSKKKHIVGYIFLGVVGLIILFSSWHFMRQYTIHFPHERYEKWMYGREEMSDYLESIKDDYETIVIAPRVEWPYIFLLYYTKYDPAKYLQEGGTVTGSWMENRNRVGDYEIRNVKKEEKTDTTLYVDTPKDYTDISPVHVIYNPDGSEALYFIHGSSL